MTTAQPNLKSDLDVVNTIREALDRIQAVAGLLSLAENREGELPEKSIENAAWVIVREAEQSIAYLDEFCDERAYTMFDQENCLTMMCEDAGEVLFAIKHHEGPPIDWFTKSTGGVRRIGLDGALKWYEDHGMMDQARASLGESVLAARQQAAQ